MCRHFLVVLLLAATLTAAERPLVRVHWSGCAVKIRFEGKTMTHVFCSSGPWNPPVPYKGLYFEPIGQLTTDDLVEKNGVVYLLADLEGNSRGRGAASSFCGAGIEQAKVLFVFDRKGKSQEPILIHYESCLFSIEDELVGSTIGHPRGK